LVQTPNLHNKLLDTTKFKLENDIEPKN
jgi:hypothetical protein